MLLLLTPRLLLRAWRTLSWLDFRPSLHIWERCSVFVTRSLLFSGRPAIRRVRALLPHPFLPFLRLALRARRSPLSSGATSGVCFKACPASQPCHCRDRSSSPLRARGPGSRVG